MEPIRGEGLLLRLPTPSDRERWLELFHDPDQLRFGSPSVVTIPDSVEDLDERIAAVHRQLEAGEPGNFVIADEDAPDRFLGTAGWSFFVPAAIRVADVGYSVHPDARGRGVATRALRTLTRWLTLDEGGLKLARVQLDHSVENPASCRTARAAGFEREGVRKAFLPLRDADAPDGVRRHDVCLHGFVPRQVEQGI
jgi:RimJ/RimL family protein N-acetyltransferase